jgi:hypothetical protein
MVSQGAGNRTGKGEEKFEEDEEGGMKDKVSVMLSEAEASALCMQGRRDSSLRSE